MISRVAMLLTLLIACVAHAVPAARVSPTIVQPRSFGYFLGDLLTQRVLYNSRRGLDGLDPPAATRIGRWLDRRRARIETDAEGRHWLCIDYQIINAPTALITAMLPAVTIEVIGGVPIEIPGWPISIGPLTPNAVFAEGELQAMRPDRAAAPLPTAALRYQVYWILGLMGLILSGWLLWLFWRNQRDAISLPFANAVRQLNRLDSTGVADNADAWIAVHRALNTTAGRAVQLESLPALFVRAPSLIPLRADIEAFFRHSNERFFARASTSASFPLLEFCRDLRRIEKSRHGTHAV